MANRVHRRIAGQCNQADFAKIEHLATAVGSLEQLDVSALSKSQKFTFVFLKLTQEKGISWTLMREAVREVLFWDEGKSTRIEIRLRRAADRKKLEEFKRLWSG